SEKLVLKGKIARAVVNLALQISVDVHAGSFKRSYLFGEVSRFVHPSRSIPHLPSLGIHQLTLAFIPFDNLPCSLVLLTRIQRPFKPALNLSLPLVGFNLLLFGFLVRRVSFGLLAFIEIVPHRLQCRATLPGLNLSVCERPSVLIRSAD